MTLINATVKGLGLCALALALGGMSLSAHAFVEEITAVFRPDPTNPMSNTFKNTTPQSGLCPWHVPAKCEAVNTFSIRNSSFRAFSNGPIAAYPDDPRKSAYFKVPSAFRDLQVTHRDTGRVETVQMRIAGIGGRWNLPAVSAWGTRDAPWDRYWYGAPAPCMPINYLAASRSYALFFWIVPENAGACSVTNGYDIEWMSYSTLEYGYELKTPNPLGMDAGVYEGSITYSMGPSGDIDFGDAMIPVDNALTFNFTLTVEHILTVTLPPGGNRVELLPEGGWQAWLNRGRQPSRLFRDQTFNIFASGRFKMKLECGLAIGNTCGLRNGAGDEVPLQMAVSLPFGLNDQYGQAVNKLPLRLDGSGTELFQARHYVNNRPGTLHFEVEREDVKSMLEQPGSTYSGLVTVIWDSEV
ncbi:hypothetical protein ASE80_03475 [Pseudomonas sp. Leaf15]|uniref:hypothetical protein n=1 Tax=unclassified Pseudomonas TaxID=196821 RepID=UPI0007029DF1|nr:MULTISPECIES: hypothetical protein [unclassified Pseudomonas]KQM52481.1 hypothetical protein ASE80_03475 [Pseudomonas sp. Leaf15]RAH03111.1 hypothetical protein DJ480_07060 [Pseudomonas sp. Leaf98]